jgi:hypothetical protein
MASGSAVALIGLARLKRNSAWQNPDNWSWRETFGFVSQGVRAAVRMTEPAALVPVKLRLPPGWRPAKPAGAEPLYSLVVGNGGAPPGLDGLHLLFRGDSLISAAYKLESVLGAFESDLDLQVAMAAAPGRIFVHAGVVGWRGRAIVIVGRPQSGTSTLVAELLRAGASYYSDQYAVLDAGGRVHPFGRPLWLCAESDVDAVRYRAAELGARVGTRALPIGVVALTRYRPGVRSQLQPVTALAAAPELLGNAICAKAHSRAALAAIREGLRGAWILRGMRGEAKAFAGLLMGANQHRDN